MSLYSIPIDYIPIAAVNIISSHANPMIWAIISITNSGNSLSGGSSVFSTKIYHNVSIAKMIYWTKKHLKETCK